MITVTCPGCEARLKVPDTLMGRKAKCNKCETVFQVPQADAAISTRRVAPTRPTKAAPEPEEEAPRSTGRRRRTEKPADDWDDREESPRGRPRKKKGSPVLLLCLAGVVVLFLLGGAGAAVFFFLRSGGQPAGMKWMPNNSELILSVRLDDILKSGAWQELKQAVPEIQRAMQDNNLNEGLPLEDMVSFVAGGPIGGGNNDIVIAIQTNKAYTAEQLLGKMREKNFNPKTAGPYTMYESGDKAFCVVDSNTIVLGQPGSVRAVLERNADPVFSQTLQDALREVSMSKSLVMVFDVQGGMRNKGPGGVFPIGGGGQFGDLATLPQKVESVGVEVAVAKDVSVRSVVLCKDAASAETVVRLVNTGKSAGAMAVKAPDLAKVLDGVQVSADGKRATITGSFSVAPLAAAAKNAGVGAMPWAGGFGPQPIPQPQPFPQPQPQPFPQPQPGVQDPPPQLRGAGQWVSDIADGQTLTYLVIVQANQKAEFRVTSDKNTDVDTWVYDQRGVLATSDTRIGKDCYVTWTSSVLQTYKIQVKNLGFGANRSTIQLDLGAAQVVQPFPNPNPQPGMGGNVVLSVHSSINRFDPPDRGRLGSHHKVHVLRMTAGKTYIIEMRSRAFDSFLRLEDAFTRELAHDDDSGGNLDARINFQANQDGVYRIIATSIFGPGMGAYTLTVREL